MIRRNVDAIAVALLLAAIAIYSAAGRVATRDIFVHQQVVSMNHWVDHNVRHTSCSTAHKLNVSF